MLTDYKSDKLPEEPGLKAAKSVTRAWRDLTKPIGALSTDKLEQFRSKYFEILSKAPNSSPFLQPKKREGRSLNSDSDRRHDLSDLDEIESNEQAYMYMSHYSTPGIVFYYLIRSFPSYINRIQNDDFGGPADRIFIDVGMSWTNCLKVISDNKELIPEFYVGNGSFLKNQF